MPESGAALASGMVFGWGPHWIRSPSPVPRGICSPQCPAAEVSPSGAILMALCISPWPVKVLRDTASASSMALGETQEDIRMSPEGETSAARHLGEQIPLGTGDAGHI